MDLSPRTPRTGPERLSATWKWIASRRRIALSHLLRGACYGAGTGLIGIAFVWVERLL
jgi:hypothetical protein